VRQIRGHAFKKHFVGPRKSDNWNHFVCFYVSLQDGLRFILWHVTYTRNTTVTFLPVSCLFPISCRGRNTGHPKILRNIPPYSCQYVMPLKAMCQDWGTIFGGNLSLPISLFNYAKNFKSNLIIFVRFEVLTAVTMMNAVFWDVVLCRSCVNWRFGGTYRVYLHGRKIRERGTSVSRWLQTEPPVETPQLYKNRKGGIVGHVGNQQKGERNGL
jgi:hypothetical protein